MSLALFGWTTVHSLWAGTAIAGLAVMALSMLGDRQARTRHHVAFGALFLMAGVPLAIAALGLDPMTRMGRELATSTIDAAIGFSAFVSIRGAIVPAAALGWLIGALVAMGRVAAQWRQLSQWRHDGVLSDGDGPAAQVVDLRTAMRVSAPVHVRHSDRAAVPMVFGWRRPTILLPATISTTLSPEQLRGVLAHELAHVRRSDYMANLAQVMLECALWFHPAAHWLSRRIRTEREYCCDDAAVRAGVDMPTYARALAALDDARDHGCLVVAAASGTLLDRIQRITGRPRPVLTVRAGLLALVSATLIAGVVFALSMAVPPAVPLDAKLRTRTPPPAGAMLPPGSAGPSLPRTPRR